MNDQIIIVFEQLKQLRLRQAEELSQQGKNDEAEKVRWKATAYQKAIEAIKNSGVVITSVENTRYIKSIGKSLSSKIGEILTTGTVEELKLIQEKQSIISLFASIHKAGNKTAVKWYNAGYRKLSDIPQEACTNAQWIGIQYHEEFSQRIPREEVQQFEEVLRQFLLPQEINFLICGSYRRGKPDSGDIDILVSAKEGVKVLDEILKCPIFTHELSHGPKKYMGVGKINQLHRRIDIEVCQPEEYPFALTYFTGPVSFNEKMRAHCKQRGYRLNEKFLADDQGNKYLVASEEELFAILGLQYLTPQERDKY